MSKINFNYHTHSKLCDGVNTLEEMAKAAYEQGFDVLGFSGHVYIWYDKSYSMTEEGMPEYVKRVNALKEQYKGKMQILLGIEQDFGSDWPVEGYDYVIGSVHALHPLADADSKDNYFGYDRSEFYSTDYLPELVSEAVKNNFNGDPYAYAERYYEMVAKLPEATKCDIIGHFDLVTKFCERMNWIDINHPRYKTAYLKALDSLSAHPELIFEINTGAMSRGYRSEPYPSLEILQEIKKRGFKIMINSDTHSIDTLDSYFDEAIKMAKEVGYTSVVKITECGFEDFEI